jgi:hypothetical protein
MYLCPLVKTHVSNIQPIKEHVVSKNLRIPESQQCTGAESAADWARGVLIQSRIDTLGDVTQSQSFSRNCKVERKK